MRPESANWRSALESDLSHEAQQSEVPPAGLVYWKAERRLRREQAERALKPIRAAEALCLTLLGAGVAVAGITAGLSLVTLAIITLGVISIYAAALLQTRRT
jgi:hypothetical protein